VTRGSIERDWLTKTLAGTVGGFGLGIATSALLAGLAPGGLAIPNKFQVAMWLVPPVWIGVIAASFMFRSGMRASAWLGGANLAAFALVAACQHFLF
jgi:hypothetical protein